MKKQFIGGIAERLSIALIATLSFVLAHAACQSVPPKTAKQQAVQTAPAVPALIDSAKKQPKTAEKLIVYYFHGNARCPTCFKLESLAKSEVETDFVDAIKNGTIEWKTVNVEEKGNEHFTDDYKLYTKSVIISTLNNGKESSWKNLDQIWQLIHDEGTYRAYIRNEVTACLAGKCL